MQARCPNCRQPLQMVGEPCAERGCRRRGYHGVPEDVLTATVDPRIGLQLDGKYLLVKVLGKGGMGVVMVALQQPLLREVALKLISGVEVDATARARFVREARAVAALDHPNVVKLVDFGVTELDEPAPYMVMELVSGARSLRQVFAEWKQSPPTWQAFGEVFGQLLAALAAAHDGHIVHRDIKPDNVMAGRAHGYEYFVRVLDFGLAKSFGGPEGQQGEMASLTDAGTAAGTPQYMAPEQLKGAGAARVDARADQYAVATMMFEVACGRRPYPPCADVMQLVFAKADPEQDPLREAPELASLGALGAVLRRAMAWSADDRYPNCTQLRADVLAAVAQLGPSKPVALVGKSADLAGRPPPLPMPRRASTAAPVARPTVEPPASGTLTIGLPATADLPTREDPVPVELPARSPAWLWPAVAITGVAVGRGPVGHACQAHGRSVAIWRASRFGPGCCVTRQGPAGCRQ